MPVAELLKLALGFVLGSAGAIGYITGDVSTSMASIGYCAGLWLVDQAFPAPAAETVDPSPQLGGHMKMFGVMLAILIMTTLTQDHQQFGPVVGMILWGVIIASTGLKVRAQFS